MTPHRRRSRDSLAKKGSALPSKKRFPGYIWNIRPDRWDWSHPDFLLRVAEERKVVVGEVTKDLLEIVELTDDVLKRLAKADSV